MIYIFSYPDRCICGKENKVRYFLCQKCTEKITLYQKYEQLNKIIYEIYVAEINKYSDTVEKLKIQVINIYESMLKQEAKKMKRGKNYIANADSANVLGKRSAAGRIGGPARAMSLTPEQRIEIARKGGATKARNFLLRKLKEEKS